MLTVLDELEAFDAQIKQIHLTQQSNNKIEAFRLVCDALNYFSRQYRQFPSTLNKVRYMIAKEQYEAFSKIVTE